MFLRTIFKFLLGLLLLILNIVAVITIFYNYYECSPRLHEQITINSKQSELFLVQ